VGRIDLKERAAITAISCRSYRIPTDGPEGDGTLAWQSTTVVVVQVYCEHHFGTGWTYSSDACQAIVNSELADALVGHDALDIAGLHEAMVRSCRNLGRPGVVAAAISAVDIALWDLKAKYLGLSLLKLFGSCRVDVPVYGSGGFTTYDELTTASQLASWVGEFGIPRVKIKIAESWGREVDRDLKRVALARKTIGPTVELFVDANGGYSRKQAARIGQRLYEEHGVTWFEEPVSSDDLEGLRLLRDYLPVDVAAGEYGYDETYFARMVAAESVDCLQIDVTRCGGFTSFMRASAIAAAHCLEVSCHCAPSLHASVAASTVNLRHVEYFHDHARIDSLLFDGVPVPKNGVLTLDPSLTGHGMTLMEADAAVFQIG